MLATSNGERVILPREMEAIRADGSPRRIMAQRGGQERFLSSSADVTIFGGARGPGKTFSLLMEVLKDIRNPNFNGIILRQEKGDFKSIIEKSDRLYSQFGTYNRSQNDMTWNFTAGGRLFFSYFSDPYDEFKKRFQGQEYAFVGVDEITHISFEKFRYILTDNRNSFSIRNRFYGTCNPDPDSWVRTFVDWWIDPEGYPIPERDGRVRYFFLEGDSVSNIYWGDTPEEVYRQCRSIVERQWKPEYEALGFDKTTMFVKSATYIRGRLEENAILVKSDPNYVANLVQQDEEQRSRDLDGNWNFKAAGDDIIKIADMEAFFRNTIQEGDGRRRASCDIAYDGGDNLVLWLWKGYHILDVFVSRLDSRTTEVMVEAKLREWGVMEKDFVFDLNGPGQDFKGKFPSAKRFNNMAAPIASCKAEEKSIRYMYSSLKSQCADILVKKILSGGISIAPELLRRKFSGKGYSGVPLSNILMGERKAIRDACTGKGFSLIPKSSMKKYVGHSPDFIEALIYRMLFEIETKKAAARVPWSFVAPGQTKRKIRLL